MDSGAVVDIRRRCVARPNNMDFIFPCDERITATPLNVLWWGLRFRIVFENALLEIAGYDMRFTTLAIQVHKTTIRRDTDMSKGPNIQEAVLALRGIH